MINKAPSKPQYAPLPLAAIGDRRLSLLEMRVLAAIASHDRLSLFRPTRGPGCYAGNQTLASECGCHHTKVSTAITRLEELGYIQRELKATKSRSRRGALRVRYDTPKGEVSETTEPDFAERTQDVTGDNRPSTLRQGDSYLCGEEEQVADATRTLVRNIFSEGENTFRKNKKNSGEPAPLSGGWLGGKKGDFTFGRELAFAERCLKRGDARAFTASFRDELETIIDCSDPGSGERGWAERLWRQSQEGSVGWQNGDDEALEA